MEPKDYNTKKGKYTHLKESERYKIEALLQEKKKPKDIAIVLGRGRSTIYKETKRGAVERLQYDLSKKKQCRADPAQRDYEAKVTGKEHELKIGKDRQSADQKLIEKEINIKLDTGYNRKLKQNTKWNYVGKISYGEVFKTRDQILTVEGSNIYEAYMVISDGKLVGFYLPAEKSYTPLRESVELYKKKHMDEQ